MKHRALIVAALGILLLPWSFHTAWAQRSDNAPRSPWLQEYAPDLASYMTPAERAEAMATAKAIEQILARSRELAQPQGFEVRTQIYGGTLPFGDRGVLIYHFWLWFFVPSQAVAKEGPRCIGVSINGTLSRHLVDESGRGFIIEPEVSAAKPGSTRVFEGLRFDEPTADRRGGLVLFTRGGAYPWVPVTREEYLKAQIFESAGKNGEKDAEAKSGLATTNYELWMKDAAERKKKLDETVATVTRIQGRAAGEELRKQQEQTERDVTAQLKAAETEERQQKKKALDDFYTDKLREQLARMTPAERSSTATAGANGELLPANDPTGHRVVTPDPEFWRVRRSRVEAQTLMVAVSPTRECSAPAVRAALATFWNSFDWAAFRRLVDAQR